MRRRAADLLPAIDSATGSTIEVLPPDRVDEPWCIEPGTVVVLRASVDCFPVGARVVVELTAAQALRLVQAIEATATRARETAPAVKRARDRA